MSFCTVVNCMDGRVQLPVIRYLMDRFGVRYVDSVTEPGPVKDLSAYPGGASSESVLRRVGVSHERHGSRLVAVVAHADCAGNPVGEKEQRAQLSASLDLIGRRFPDVSLLGLWLDEQWVVQETELREPTAGR